MLIASFLIELPQESARTFKKSTKLKILKDLCVSVRKYDHPMLGYDNDEQPRTYLWDEQVTSFTGKRLTYQEILREHMKVGSARNFGKFHLILTLFMPSNT